MTALEFICIVCSAGYVFGPASLILLILAREAVGAGRPTAGARALIAAFVVLMCSGFVGCAVEDRVCEMASRGQL